MSMFKLLINRIKMKRLMKLLAELCDHSSCRNCASLLPDCSECGHTCAQSCVIEQAINKWYLSEKE